MKTKILKNEKKLLFDKTQSISEILKTGGLKSNNVQASLTII